MRHDENVATFEAPRILDCPHGGSCVAVSSPGDSWGLTRLFPMREVDVSPLLEGYLQRAKARELRVLHPSTFVAELRNTGMESRLEPEAVGRGRKIAP